MVTKLALTGFALHSEVMDAESRITCKVALGHSLSAASSTVQRGNGVTARRWPFGVHVRELGWADLQIKLTRKSNHGSGTNVQGRAPSCILTALLTALLTVNLFLLPCFHHHGSSILSCYKGLMRKQQVSIRMEAFARDDATSEREFSEVTRVGGCELIMRVIFWTRDMGNLETRDFPTM